MLNSTYLLNVNFRWPTDWSGANLGTALMVVFSVLLVLETAAPRDVMPSRRLRQSYLTNMGLFVANSLAMSFLSASSLMALAERHALTGLLSALPSPAGKAVIALLLLDLLMYVWHVASHRYLCLWMFHRVHHNDRCVNLSTAFRVHILELLIIHVLKALLILALGIEATVLLASEAVMTGFILFHHTNIRFAGEKWLGYVFIVPAMHRTHHSLQRHEHDSNYGAVLSIWDRLFGTLAKQTAAQLGIKGESPQHLLGLIQFGCRWPTVVTAPVAVNLEAMIAEAAYYKAEKRGFSPGDDLRDWLEAKKDILALVYGDKGFTVKTAVKPQWGSANHPNRLLHG